MSRTPEGRIKEQIKKLLNAYGDDVYWYMPIGTGYGRRTLDFLGCAWGIFFAVEAKRSPKARLTALQLATVETIQRANGVALVVGDEAGLEALRRFLEYARKGPP